MSGFVMAPVPVIDLAAVREKSGELDAQDPTVAAWDHAMRSAGFAVVMNSGVDAELVDAAFKASREFFLGRSAEAKLAFCFGKYGNEKGGFSPPGAESVSRTLAQGGRQVADKPADLVESYVLRSKDWADPTRLAIHAPELCGDTVRNYVASLTALLDLLHRLSGVALGAGDHFFDEFYKVGASLSLRLAHYPPTSPSSDNNDPTCTAQRYGAHCDYEGFTILAVEDENDRCLEVFLDDQWQKVSCPRGGLIVNVGELMTTWSGGRWASTLHRVIKPEHGKDRFSLPFFTGPRRDAIVLPIGETDSSKGIQAHDHLMAQLKKSNV